MANGPCTDPARLFKEEEDRQIQRAREIQALPEHQRKMAEEEENALQLKWQFEYEKAKADEADRPLYKDGAWFKEASLSPYKASK